MTALDVLTAAQGLMQLGQAGVDLYRRMQMGELTEEQAVAEWQRTRETFAAGKAMWDQAGR